MIEFEFDPHKGYSADLYKIIMMEEFWLDTHMEEWQRQPFMFRCEGLPDHYWWLKFWTEECPSASLGEAARMYQLKAFL